MDKTACFTLLDQKGREGEEVKLGGGGRGVNLTSGNVYRRVQSARHSPGW